MQILVFLAFFFHVNEEKLLGGWLDPLSLGKGRVKDVLVQYVSPSLSTKDSAFGCQCLHLTWFGSHGDR